MAKIMNPLKTLVTVTATTILASPTAMPEVEPQKSDLSFLNGKVFGCVDPNNENNFHMFYFGEGEGWEVEFLIGDLIIFMPVARAYLDENVMILERIREHPAVGRVASTKWTTTTSIGRRSLSFSTQAYEKVGNENPRSIRSFKGTCSILETSFESKDELEELLTKKAF